MKPTHVIIILVHALAAAIILAIKTPDIIAWFGKPETVMVVVYRSVEECVGDDPSDARRHLCLSAEAAAKNDEVALATHYNVMSICRERHQQFCKGPDFGGRKLPGGAFAIPARIGWAMAATGSKPFRPVPVYPGPTPNMVELAGGVVVPADAKAVELEWKQVTEIGQRYWIVE